MTDALRVLLVGSFAPGALERSYANAFSAIGCHVSQFDMPAAIERNVRFRILGQHINRFIPVEPWIAKANRELFLASRAFRPDLIVVFGQTMVRAGALAQIRSSLGCKLAWIWPDTMVFLRTEVIQSLPLYDYVGSYSEASVEQLRKLGAAHAAWLPLAADPAMHAKPAASIFSVDVGFIGQWRPEREVVMSELMTNLPNLEIKIWGPDWGRRCRGNRQILNAWQGKSLYAGEFAAAVASCKVHLNLIDPTNYPAANMRFFELLMAGGFQVTSDCPEMRQEFRDQKEVVYFRDTEALLSQVQRYLADDEQRHEIAEQGLRLVREGHMYTHRVRQLMSSLAF